MELAIYDEHEVALLQEQAAREEAELAMMKAVIGSVFSVRKPRDAIAGTASGLKTVARGLGLGLASLVAQPYMGAKTGGAKGFVKGVGAGVATCAASTVAGTVVGTGQIVRGVVNTPSAVVQRARGQVWNSERRAWEQDWYSLPEEAAKVLAGTAGSDQSPPGGKKADALGSPGAAASSGHRRSQRKVADSSLYDLLEVTPEATEAEIRRAFYKKSLALHPDKNPGNPETTKLFQAVSDAYRVLGDADRRRTYDEHGKDSAAAALPKIEPVVFFAALFGSHHFEPYVGRLRLAQEIDGDLQSLLREAMGGAEEEAPSLDVLKVHRAAQQMKEVQRQRQVKCALDLAARLSPVVDAEASRSEEERKEAFAKWERERRNEVQRLAQAPCGAEMLYLVGWMYANRARQFFAGSILGRVMAKMQGEVHLVQSKAKLAGAVGRSCITVNSIAKTFEKQGQAARKGKEMDAQSAPSPSAPASSPEHAGSKPDEYKATGSDESPTGDEAPNATEEAGEAELGVGTLVILHGLRGSPELNNEVGMICDFEPESGRYIVHVLPDIGCKSLRRENLQVLEESASAGSAGDGATSSSAPPPKPPPEAPPSSPPKSSPRSPDAPDPEDGRWAEGEDAGMAEALKDCMPLFHDALWNATALDIEFTLSQVIQKVLRDMSVSKAARRQRAEALLRLGNILQEPMRERRRQTQPLQTGEVKQPLPASCEAAKTASSMTLKRTMLSRLKPRVPWRSSTEGLHRKAQADEVKQKRMEAALAMMVAGASTEDVDEMLAARAAMDGDL